MQLKLNKKIFEKNIESISNAIQSNSALQSLRGILVKATPTEITLLSSNGNLSIKKTIKQSKEIEIIETGEILIPGMIFLKIIKNSNDTINIKTRNNSLIIKNEESKITLQLLNKEEYPTINFETIGKELIIDSKIIKSLINNVSFAASENDKRIILNGVNLRLKDRFLIVTATNSFRLAQEKIEINSDIEFDITILSKNLKEFIPKEFNGDFKINVNDSKIITNNNNTIISSKLIDGVYPNIEKLIPLEFKYVLEVNSNEMINLIEKATIVSDEANKIIKLTINSNKIIMESKKNEIGNTVVEMDNHTWNNKEFTIILNADFFKKSISKFKGEISISFNGPYEPVVIKGKSNANLLQLILPFRTY